MDNIPLETKIKVLGLVGKGLVSHLDGTPWLSSHLDVTPLVDLWSYVSLLVLVPILVVVPCPFCYDDLTLLFLIYMTT